MITCDTREPKDLRLVLKMMADKEGQRVGEDDALPHGDFWIEPDRRPNYRAVIERKSVSDLHHSIIDGRLFKQMKKCIASGAEVFLLIEGHYWGETKPGGVTLKGGGVHPNAMRGALLAIQREGVTIIHTQNPDDTVRAILWLARKVRTPYESWMEQDEQTGSGTA